ncbi:MAG TPA: chaperone modulator CbpM [Burkholderiaceae bacterium]|nr:chaperone modulator CbpM [Burkholderiaceae bacterium]
MNTSPTTTVTIVEEDRPMSLAEFARACRAREELIHVWVIEGVLRPLGDAPAQWRFEGAALRRAKLALTLTRELEINAAGVALALDLMDEIEALKARLRRGARG